MKPPLLLRLVASSLLLVFAGCESMMYSRYDGPQKAWPVGSSLTDGVYEVPVYKGWPEKAYEVLGVVQFDNPSIDWNRGDAMQAAKQAKAAGGDAIILLPKGGDPSPTGAAVRQDLGLAGDRAVAVVVKWK